MSESNRQSLSGSSALHLTQLAQDRQVECNVWRGRHAEAEAEVARLRDVLERIANSEFELTGDLINVCNRALRGEEL